MLDILIREAKWRNLKKDTCRTIRDLKQTTFANKYSVMSEQFSVKKLKIKTRNDR